MHVSLARKSSEEEMCHEQDTKIENDGAIQSSKDLLDAIQILSSDEELSSKFLQDPNSITLSVRHVLGLPAA